MKAVRIHEYGGPEVLKYEDAPRPQAAKGEVLVRVHGAGVNPADWRVRAGGFMRDQITLPLVLGWDASGIIEDVGPGVEDLKVGDEVYARPKVGRDGAYAEYIVIPSNVVARKPKSIDHVNAAAVPVVGLTAWQALFEPSAIALEPGQTVLIHGAAGGVGTFAVQLARGHGARVIATASGKNDEFLRKLGASEVIDYTRNRFEDVVHDADAVLDTIGGDTQKRSWGVLKPGGVLASIVGIGEVPAEAKARGIRSAAVYAKNDREYLDRLTALIDAGKLAPVIAEVLPLAQARRAHELSEGGHVRGKLVLQTI
jgi:NADPH:quinone reductase-like Zn-dependent oxidoreductase